MSLVKTLIYNGVVTPIIISGVGIVNKGDNFSVSHELADSLLQQVDNYALAEAEHPIKDKK
jgi:hypothetical protein